MEEGEEYESDSTVLLTDYVGNPEKIHTKRRRLSKLQNKAVLLNEFEDENTAPDDVNMRIDGSSKKERNNEDKNWYINKYLACFSKNNDTNIQNNDSKHRRNLDLNEKQVTNNSLTNEDNISRAYSTNIDNYDQIICLDSDDEIHIDDKSQDQVRKSVEISVRNDHISSPNSFNKPAPLANRRATTDFIERNDMQLSSNVSQELKENQHAKIRVMKPFVMNSRRATTHFEENHFNCKEETESNEHRSIIPRLANLSANVNTCGHANAICSNITGVSAAVLKKNTHSASKHTSKKPSLYSKDSSQDTNISLNVKTQTEPKHIKIDRKFTDPAQKDIKTTALQESENFEACEPYVRNELRVKSAKHKAIDDYVESENSNGNSGNKSSEGQNTTGAVNEKRACVDEIDAKPKSTAINVKSDKRTANKDIQVTVLNTNEKNNTPIAKTFNNVCANTEILNASILQKTSQSYEKKESTKVQDAEVPDGAQHTHVINKVQDTHRISEVIGKQKASKVQGNQGATKTQGEFETMMHGISEVHDKRETNKVQDNPETRKLQDGEHNDHGGSKLEGENLITKTYDQPKAIKQQDGIVTNDAQHMLETSKILDGRKSSEEIKKVQDDHETSKLLTSNKHNMSNTLNKQKTSKKLDVIADETYDQQETDKLIYHLDSNSVQGEQIPSEALNKEPSEAGNKQGDSNYRENNANEVQDQEEQETQNVNNENKTSESINVQETVQENETTREMSCDQEEDNDRLLKFQVGFFTLVKEYLKDKFPEFAMKLHNLIENLIIDARNGHVHTDVKYSCPKCSRVSNYSSRILNNAENKENLKNVEGTPKCGFCNGIRKLHNSYLKRFLDKKEVVGKNHATQAEKSRRDEKILTREIVINNPQTTSASSAAILKENGRSSYVDREPTLKEKTQSDICSKINNNATLVATGTDTIKLTDKEVCEHDTPVIKSNEICAQSKPGHMDDEASSKTDFIISNKRKRQNTPKETPEHKRLKTGTEEYNAQGVKNLTASDSQTNIQRIDKLANERPNKVQIISIQNITFHGTGRPSSGIETHLSKGTGVNSAAKSGFCDNNISDKPSYESTKKFQTNTIDRNTHGVGIKPNINRGNIITEDKRGKHFSADTNLAIKGVTNENMIDKERQVEIDGNDKAMKKDTNNTPKGSISETDEANPQQIRNAVENDKEEEGALKPLMDCFVKLKNSVKEKEGTPRKTKEENKTAAESASKIRSKIQNDKSNILDHLPRRDDRKIVMKYVCPICTSIYAHSTKLFRHMKERHNPNLTTIPENCERLQCPFCRTLLSNKNYNKHVKGNHSEIFQESIDVVEISNTNQGKNEKHGSIKNKTFLSCEKDERNKTLESTKSENDCSASDKILTANNSTKQNKKKRRSEYQHLIRRIKMQDVNDNAQDEIHNDETEDLGLVEDDTQDISIEHENDSPATTSTGEITSHSPTSGSASVLHVKHTEQCYHKSNKSSGFAAERNALRNEEDLAPSDCNDMNFDTIENCDVNLLRADNMHNVDKTCPSQNNCSKSDKSKPQKSDTSEESINIEIDDDEQSRRRISNESTSNSNWINNDKIIPSGDEIDNGKHQSDELSIRYENNDKQCKETTKNSHGSNNYKGKEYSKDDCIKATDFTVRKRNERTAKLFGEENEASELNKIKESKSNKDARSEQSSGLTDTKTRRRRGNGKAVDRRRKVTMEQQNTESSDSDWIISDDEISYSYDEILCAIKKQQVVRKLFSGQNEPSAQNGRNAESRYTKTPNKQIGSELLTEHYSSNRSTETDENNEDSDEDTLKSSKHAIKKRKERLSKFFGDDNETCVSDKISDRQASSKENGRSDRQSAAIKNANKESFPGSNCGHKVHSVDETLKVSEHTLKRRIERISKQFADDEPLVQSSGGNQQLENSDINYPDCRIPIVDGNTTEVVNVSEEYVTEYNVEMSEISNNGTSNENCVNEKGHQDTTQTTSYNNSGKDSDMYGATDRNQITADAEHENMNAVNAENKSRDDDRIEINMIDSLLKEFASVDHQNDASTSLVNNDDKIAETLTESQAMSGSAAIKTCLENIRITNVVSVEGKIHVFVCRECNYGTDAYDNAIRHSQNHYNLIEDHVTHCNICQINYDSICFERHQASHDKYLGSMKIKFSHRWLYNNWQAIFESNDISLSDAEDMQVKSIYKTFCVNMIVKENGPWQSAVYLCGKCNTCVPALDVETHVQQKCTFVNYPCRYCDRLFSTYELRNHHEIYHTNYHSSELFKTIVFNDQKDEIFNLKLIQFKTQSKEKQGIVDLFKCLCGLCFVSLKNFKLHFAACYSETNDGGACPKCTSIRRFSTTELEEHLLHHSLLNIEFRVQKITFQQESIIESPEREQLSETFDRTSNDEDLTDMVKDETLTQITDEKNRQENVDTVENENTNRDLINETSDSAKDDAAQIRSNDEDLIIKEDMLKYEVLTQSTDDGDKRRETIDNTETEDQINEMVPAVPDITADDIAVQIRSNYEEFIIKKEMLKDEALTQTTNEGTSEELPDSGEKEEVVREGTVQEIKEIEGYVPTETSQEIIVVEEPEHPINIEDSQELNEVQLTKDPMTIETPQEMEVEETEHPLNIEDTLKINEVQRTDDPINIETSQEMEVESGNLITIDDSDDTDDDVEFIGGSFPNTSTIFPLRNWSKTHET